MSQPANQIGVLADRLQLLLLLILAFAAGAESALRWRNGRWPFDSAPPDITFWTPQPGQSPGMSTFAQDDAGAAVRIDRPGGSGSRSPGPTVKKIKEITERLEQDPVATAPPETGAATQKKEIFDRILPEP